MMKKDDKEFDDFLRRKMEELPTEFNATQWSKMESLLQQSAHTRSALLWQGIKAKLFVAAGIITGTSALFFIALNLTDNGKEKTQVISSKSALVQTPASKTFSGQPVVTAEEKLASASQVNTRIITESTSASRSLASASTILTQPTSVLNDNYTELINRATESWSQDVGLGTKELDVVVTTDESDAPAHDNQHSITSHPSSSIEPTDDLLGLESALNPIDAAQVEIVVVPKGSQASLLKTEAVNSNGITSNEFESAQLIDPIVSQGKLLKQNIGFAAGYQGTKAYNTTHCSLASGGFIELSHVLQLGKRVSLQSELGLNYREGLNYSKTSTVYIPGFGIEEYHYSVRNKGSMNIDLLSGISINLGNAGLVNLGTGPQMMIDTRSRIDKDLDTLLIPEGNWGYRGGYKKLDWMIRAGYQLPLCHHWEWMIQAGLGLRSDNTDDTYFGVIKNDRNLYLRTGLRYMIQSRKAQSIPERFSEK